MRPRVTAFVLAVLCFLAVPIAGSVHAISAPGQSGYELAVEGAIETPERTVTVEGNEYTLRSVGSVEPGNSIRVDVTVPSERVYDVELRNADEQVVDRRRLTESTSVSFDTSLLELDPGTYALVLLEDGQIEAIQPVVVSGYDLTVDVPSAVAPGDTATATVSLQFGARSTLPEAVTVVAFRGDEVVRVTATRTGQRQYEAALAFDSDAPTGEYSVYAVAEGTEQLTGNYPISLAVDDGVTLQVQTPDEEGDDDDDIGGGGGAGQPDLGDGNDDQPVEEPAAQPPANETPAENETDTGPDGEPGGSNETIESGSNNDTSDSDQQGTDSVIAPTNGSTGGETASSQSISPVLVLIAVSCLLGYVIRSSRRDR